MSNLWRMGHFSENYLQGENMVVEEDNFWDTLPVPKIIPKAYVSLIDSDKHFVEKTVGSMETRSSTTSLPGITLSETGGEKPQQELQVYTRRQFLKSATAPFISQVNDQSNLPSDGSTSQGNIPPTPITSSSFDTSPSDLDISIALRKGTQACITISLLSFCLMKNCQTLIKHLSKISNLCVPRTIQEALGDPNWKSSLMEEMNALKRNDIWTVVDLPKDKNIVGCKWVFTVKCKPDGSVERYKVRLVAK